MVTKEMTIADVLKQKPQTAPVFQAIGMHCLGCAIASMETVEEAAQVHGVDLDDLMSKLNEA